MAERASQPGVSVASGVATIRTRGVVDAGVTGYAVPGSGVISGWSSWSTRRPHGRDGLLAGRPGRPSWPTTKPLPRGSQGQGLVFACARGELTPHALSGTRT